MKTVATDQTLKTVESRWHRINDAVQEAIYYSMRLDNIHVVFFTPLLHDIKDPAKQKINHKLGRAEYDNIHYGAVGAAAGIPEGILLRGAGTAQILAGTSNPVEFAKFQSDNNYGDDPVDQLWIRAGIDYARRAGF